VELKQQAVETLRGNDRGDYTVPTGTGLYPAQWNWDSCLVALGLAQFDEPRAVAEIETLFGGQWPDGMVPHILFHGDDSTYFPNAAVWQAGPTGRSSGITQPLVAATVVRQLFEHASDPAIRARLTALVPKLLAWHRWCYAARDPHDTGLVSIIHPWESGMDNSPLWDDALNAVEPGPPVAHLRKDTGFAAANHRPTAPEYDRYINLVIRFRDNGYRADRLYDIAPFRVADIGFNAILQRSNQDLRSLLAATGDIAGAAEVATMEERTGAAIARCWHEEDRFFYGVDTRTGKIIRKPGISGLLPLFADAEVAARRPRLVERLEGWLARVAYERLSGQWVEILGKPHSLDQRQAVATDSRGQVGAPVAPQTVDQHPVHNQPHRAAPITLRLELRPLRLEARYAISDPSQPALQPLH
jgi:hypothetical protein